MSPKKIGTCRFGLNVRRIGQTGQVAHRNIGLHYSRCLDKAFSVAEIATDSRYGGGSVSFRGDCL